MNRIRFDDGESKMIDLVTGGAASGKSEYAERLLTEEPSKIYLATMYNDGSKSVQYRVARHKELRKGKGFSTIECPAHLERLSCIRPENRVLLEDLPNLLTNEMYMERRSADEIMDSIKVLNQKVKKLVIVTGQIFSDGRIYDSFTEEFIRNLAQLNRSIANLAECETVTEVVCGIPVRIK